MKSSSRRSRSSATRRTRTTSSRNGPRVRGKGAKRSADHKNRVTICMYRQGLGDCFLISLPQGKGSRPFRIMIDCGVILGTSDAATIMTKVVNNIVEATGGDSAQGTKGEIDLLVATHRHWDHLSGFVQASDAFNQLQVRETWLGWTENPGDDLARKLGRERDQALVALRRSVDQLHLAGASEAADEISGILSFFGAAKGGPTAEDALAQVRKIAGSNLQYRDPEKDGPIALGDTRATLYVLGPPRDEKKLGKTLPSKSSPETYGLAEAALAVGAALDLDEGARPFSSMRSIPFSVASEMSFFKERYFRPGTTDQEWRRIDAAWVEGASELALRLDSVTNNTSLALAIELEDGAVMLFVADAQVGNWLSWQELKWPNGSTGPGLLKNAIFYKVGHHGSHNATLREKGLELMEKLKVAMIPVDHAMALKKGWGRMPLDAIVKELDERTNGMVIRADQPAPIGEIPVIATDLFYEISL